MMHIACMMHISPWVACIFWRRPSSCVKTVSGWMTGWQNRNRRRRALSSLTSKSWKERATSPSSEAWYWCTAATTWHVFARRTSRHLLHRTPSLSLWIAFTTFLVLRYLNSACCFLQAMSIWPSLSYNNCCITILAHQFHVLVCSVKDMKHVETNTNFLQLVRYTIRRARISWADV